MGLLNVGLKKEDRQRFDNLLSTLQDFKQILHNLRYNDEIVIKVQLNHRNTRDDIRK